MMRQVISGGAAGVATALAIGLAALGLTVLLMACGCAPQATEMERFSDRLIVEVIKPAVEKAIAETVTDSAALQGSVQGIHPGYTVEVEGFFGTGVKTRATVYLDGVAGTLAGNAQATASRPAEGGAE